MQIFTAPQTIPDTAKGAVLAIGNFDGVHRGHQALLELARKRALAAGRPFGILTFDPHPRSYFSKSTAPFRITPGGHRLEQLAYAKPDFIFTMNFNEKLAHTSADDFMNRVLRHDLGTDNLVVGENFHFGHMRTGSAETLRENGFALTTLAPVTTADGKPYSSSHIRSLIAAGEIEEASSMLGWTWTVKGIVCHGDKRGRTLGYPTANVPLRETIHPAYGIYAGLVRIEGEKEWRQAALNIGIRPMFKTAEALLEAHILDFTGDIYDKNISIRPLLRIRAEEKFESLDALKEQIETDCQKIRFILSRRQVIAA
ncbi:MAG: bifunctional riboflavin kinase/FAD synthetase [Alphaproteobacteria bacterium]|nr:bifunctional riboflavin kinase/FAD synthetase [Alphaproteobacteria bacterium]